MGKRKEYPVFEQVEITDIGAEGNALTRVDDRVLFVPMAIPGDVVDVKVIKKRRKFFEGKVIKFHKYSQLRIDPVCSHFGICGGCKWQHLPYDLQLKYKEKQVIDNLKRIGKLDLPVHNPIIGSKNVFNYRNKLEYTFSNRRWLTEDELNSGIEFRNRNALGFHIPGLFDKVLDINECHLQPDPSNAIRNTVRAYAESQNLDYFDIREQRGFLRNLIIRNTVDGQFMVIVVFFYDDKKKREGLLDLLCENFPQITSLWYVINAKKNDSLSDQLHVLYQGEDHIIESINGLKFRIGPKSFFQTNTYQSIELYNVVRDFAGLTGKEIVYDLYTGAGTIANYVASRAGKVIGIEYVEEAIVDAKVNSELNGIHNTLFFAGDMKNVLSDEFVKMNGQPDVIIADPPRAGMHEDVIKMIISVKPEKIVYVSCNPATQARDIALLSDNYSVISFQPVDMFPHTHHIENVVLLGIKSHGKVKIV